MNIVLQELWNSYDILCSFIFTQNFKVEVLGVDLSKNMIDIGIQRAKEFKDDKVMYVCKHLILASAR